MLWMWDHAGVKSVEILANAVLWLRRDLGLRDITRFSRSLTLQLQLRGVCPLHYEQSRSKYLHGTPMPLYR
jgi:hypothetical protein